MNYVQVFSYNLVKRSQSLVFSQGQVWASSIFRGCDIAFRDINEALKTEVRSVLYTRTSHPHLPQKFALSSEFVVTNNTYENLECFFPKHVCYISTLSRSSQLRHTRVGSSVSA